MLLRLKDLRGHGGRNGDAQFGQPRREAVLGGLVVGRLDAHQRFRRASVRHVRAPPRASAAPPSRPRGKYLLGNGAVIVGSVICEESLFCD